MSKSTCFTFAAFLFLIVLQVGCTAEKPSEVDELKNFGLMYFNTQEVLQKPPTEWSQVLRLVDVPDLKEDHDRLMRFKSAGYDIVWGGDVRASDASSTVLCYSKKTLAEGGPVLFVDGSVLKMSAADLAKKVSDGN